MAFPYLDWFQLIHCMASYYESKNQKAFVCFFKSGIDMIPSNDPSSQVLKEGLLKYPLEEKVLQNNHTLLQWSYQFYNYFNRQMFGREIGYNDFIKIYNRDNIKLSFWSHPCWKMIHYYPSIYNGREEQALSYKAFMSCLQFLVPCPKCRDHLKTNLSDHPIDQYFSSASDLFTWSYILHQLVSSQLGKKGISLSEARILYGLESL